MNALQPPDTHHLLAAQGWVELGNPAEATQELEKIAPDFQLHPEVMEVRWHICSKEKQWDTCLEIADRLIQSLPDNAVGWKHRSVALHFLKRTQEAYDAIQPALEKFPKDWILQYDTACYCAQLGKLDEARKRLKQSYKLGDEKLIKPMALNDPDLEPLWKEIAEG